MFANTLKIAALATLAVLGLSACGEKEGSNGSNGKDTGIHITYVAESDLTTCKEGRGGIRIQSYYDTNGNNTKDNGEAIIEDASYVECYKTTYK